jgi:hypothetical protein
MKHSLKNIHLPKDSRNEQLETISNNHFCPLFDETKFILKPEYIDNGVDFRIELKENGNKIGFGLNFQLKSTENIEKNKDGSYSKSIETSNIEYLLNNGQSAYYGFYVLSENIFYYEDLYFVINLLNQKNENWQEQPNHSVRFTKKLTVESINDLYKTSYERGLMLRKVHATLAENLNNIERNEKILIDNKGNLSTDSEIEIFIEKYGWLMNDECKWNEIITLHKKTSIGATKSALCSFFVGLSYSYTGEYFKALDYMKLSFENIQDLDEYVRDYVIYAYYELQYLFSLISKENYNKGIESISKDSYIRSYLELDKIEDLIPNLFSSDDFSSKEYEERILTFLKRNDINDRIKLQAKIGFAEYTGQQLICSTPIMFLFNPEWIQSNFILVNKNFRELLKEVQKEDKFFLAHSCTLKHNKFLIEFEAVCKPRAETVLGFDIFKDIQQSLYLSYKYFSSIGHVYNQIFSLTILLESFELTKNKKKRTEVINSLNSYAERYNSPELKKKIDFVVSGGTFANYMLEKVEKIKQVESEIQQMRDELILLDEREKNKKNLNKDCNIIHVFPAGYFQIPKNKTNKCFEILNITNEVENKLNWFFSEGIIPVINSYSIDIISEGYGEGNLEYKGIESYRNMYRIRKAFFENEFYKTDIRF